MRDALDARDFTAQTVPDRCSTEALLAEIERVVRQEPERCATCGWIIEAPWSHPVYGASCRPGCPAGVTLGQVRLDGQH